MEVMEVNVSESVRLLQRELSVTRANLDDFFITVSTILVFGKEGVLRIVVPPGCHVCCSRCSDAGRFLVDGDGSGPVQECHQYSTEEYTGRM